MTPATTKGAQLTRLRQRESILMFKTKTQLPWQECPMSTADPVPEAGPKPYNLFKSEWSFLDLFVFCPNPDPCPMVSLSVQDCLERPRASRVGRRKGQVNKQVATMNLFCIFRVMLTNFLKLIFILVCSCMQAEAGEAAKEDPDKQPTDIDSWFGDHLNRIYEMFFISI